MKCELNYIIEWDRGDNMNITLRCIEKENWLDCIQLKVAENQKDYIPSNLYSIAESKYETGMMLLGIYQGVTMVGFASYILDQEGDMNLYKLMIDQRYQGRGYGKKSLDLLMDRIKKECIKNEVWLSLHPNNSTAISLYENYGFCKELTGLESDDEIFLKYIF